MRVVVIDQQPLFREGLRAFVDRQVGMQVVGAAGHAREGFRLVDQLSPDVVVVDLVLPGMGGLATIKEILRRRAQVAVLAVSSACYERDVLDALSAGAGGFVAKTDPPEAFVEGLRAVGRGLRFLGPCARGLALPAGGPTNGTRAGTRPDPDVLTGLSPREREVFDLIVKGFKNREMARELCISIKTVETHRLHINRKLACSNSLDLLRFALANRIYSWSDELPTGEDGVEPPAAVA
jgi:DNA-binding NarL/FixJ family response regulator